MSNESLTAAIMLIVLSSFIIILLAWAYIIDWLEKIRAKEEARIRNIKSIKGIEVKQITKKDAICLIKKYSCNPRQDIKTLNKGTKYFIYNYTSEGWMEEVNIGKGALLITKEFKVDKEKSLNEGSLILIFDEFGSPRYSSVKPYNIIRHVWAIQKIVKGKEIDSLSSIYDRDDFKVMIERYEDIIKKPWELSEDFIRQAKIQAIINDGPTFISLTKQSGENLRSFKLYDAINCFQVVSKIEGL